MSECSHNCGSCSSNCSERTAPQSLLADPNPNSSIKKIIGVVSGKGGVGKSSVTSLLAVEMNRLGYNVGILDADITGPSIPQMFNIHTQCYGTEAGIFPAVSAKGINVMSMNLLLEKEEDAVIYRGPVIAGIVKQFYTDVIWEDIDVLFVDMPPGTGDVPLTVFQSFPVDGIVIVSTPQQLVSMIVSKACDMADKMNVPVLGLVENMSYIRCPDCGKKLDLFKNSHIDDIAEQYNLNVLAKLPMAPEVMEAADEGKIEDVEFNYLQGAVEVIEELIKEDEDVFEVVALPCDEEGTMINEHYGRSEFFKLYRLAGGHVIDSQVIANKAPHHEAATYLRSIGVKTIICGNVGEHNVANIQANRVKLYEGISGETDKVIEEYLNGTLKSNPEGNNHACCSHHEEGGCCCHHDEETEQKSDDHGCCGHEGGCCHH